MHLDRRADRPALDAPLADALTALREFDWAKAAEQLRRLPEDRARHPLVRLLHAWCLENDRRLGSRDLLVGELLEVGQSGAPDLLRFVSAANFPSLTDSQRYAIQTLQPEATRTAEDCSRLADAAIAAGKPRRTRCSTSKWRRPAAAGPSANSIASTAVSSCYSSWAGAPRRLPRPDNGPSRRCVRPASL